MSATPIACTLRGINLNDERILMKPARHFLTAAAVLVISASPQVALAKVPEPVYDETAARADCTKEWGSDFQMIEYCLNKRHKGFRTFEAIANDAPDSLDPALTLCTEEWGNEWEMVAHCARKQLRAISSMLEHTQDLPKDVGDVILSDCANEWEPDWKMVEYCMGKQARAWRSLNN
ncbi:hypothetical protein K3725_09845 [Leisingera sp. S132]|uniref:hypothetical protein n=1 Tax=Leisingera sp. S132 TaxID=2867016 RepID=UPI0021A477D3|nr:hypothetical protein [Leisingera sp. S132]UWQ77625.1 hypothetical protein K3725_09845 [Leisingera sp. S132]